MVDIRPGEKRPERTGSLNDLQLLENAFLGLKVNNGK
jgi:hypothetical protein